MTVTVTTSRVSYAGNGATVAFSAPFYFLASADLVVISTVVATNVSTTLALATDYTVTGAGVASGGTVTTTVAPAVGTTLVIYRSPPITQSVDYQPNDPFPAQTHETALDRLTMIAQRQGELSSRSFRLADGDVTGVSTILPIPTASNFVGWNAAATGLQNYTAASLALLVASGSAQADTFTGNGSTTAFVLTASPGALANLSVSVGGVVQIPTLNYTWTGGTTLTFTAAPPNLAKVLVRYQQGLVQGATDSAAASYVPAGTGAVTTNVQTKLRESVSVKDFGAVGNGVADDTAAIQAAITATQGSTVALFFPTGNYKISSTLSITGAAAFIGASNNSVTISWTSTSLTVFNVITDSACAWQNLKFSGPAVPVSGSVIALAGTTHNSFSTIYDCTFSNSYNAIYCTSAYALKISNCYFYNFIRYGVHIQNTYNVDAGDSSISNCIFSGPLGGTNVGVYQESSGGLRLVNNKFNTGAYNYKLSLSTGAITTDLIISGNSFENANVANIQLTGNTSGTFSNTAITGNQFALAPISILVNWGYYGLSKTTISGNVFALSAAGTACISLDYITLANITGNTFAAGAATTPTGILSTVNASGVIAANVFDTATWGSKVTNASGNLLVLPNRTHYSIQAVTTNVAFASLYSASGTITFPFTFGAAPTITASVNTVSGGISVATYSVTASGFSYTVIGATNGGTGSFSYVASGLF